MAKDFKITIKTSNAAFEGEDRQNELARILREVADDIEVGIAYGMITDINGNTVGSWSS